MHEKLHQQLKAKMLAPLVSETLRFGVYMKCFPFLWHCNSTVICCFPGTPGIFLIRDDIENSCGLRQVN